MENELAMINENQLVADLDSARSQVFCSFACETREEKAKLYKAANNPDFKLADSLGEVIMVQDVYCELVTVINKETGETSQTPRIVLIDSDGYSYASLSSGIYRAVRKLIQCFGVPTWDDPVPVKVKQVNIGKNRMYTLDVEI